jgi:hypothetical protein
MGEFKGFHFLREFVMTLEAKGFLGTSRGNRDRRHAGEKRQARQPASPRTHSHHSSSVVNPHHDGQVK